MTENGNHNPLITLAVLPFENLSQEDSFDIIGDMLLFKDVTVPGQKFQTKIK